MFLGGRWIISNSFLFQSVLPRIIESFVIEIFCFLFCITWILVNLSVEDIHPSPRHSTLEGIVNDSIEELLNAPLPIFSSSEFLENTVESC